MWKLKQIEAENICAFKELTYILEQGVTTLVFGNNRDNESQHSNGSGKSALIECIALGITGGTLRKVKNEEIINDNAGECAVRLEFFNPVSDETFGILRKILRKGGSTVECSLKKGGREVPGEALQPGVDAYNKYILEKLGITKDELFNNFILSKHRYQNFLSCSDNAKKEIINRFSHAGLVDAAIAQVVKDKAPVQEKLREAELEAAGLEGRIGMLAEQIAKEEDSKKEKERTKTTKLAELGHAIGEKRALIRDCREETEALNASLSQAAETEEKLQRLENTQAPLEECLAEIRRLLAPFGCRLSGWQETVRDKKEEIAKLAGKLAAWDKDLEETKKKLIEATRMRNSLKEEYRAFSHDYRMQANGHEEELGRLNKQAGALNARIGELGKQKRQLSILIENLHNKLAGTIACPECGCRFILSDKDFNIDAAQKELEEKERKKQEAENGISLCGALLPEMEQAQEKIRNDRKALDQENESWEERVGKAEKTLRQIAATQEENVRCRENAQKHIFFLAEELDGIRRRMFDEAFSLLEDACARIERETCRQEEETKAAESAIGTLEKTIRELKEASPEGILRSLKAALREYRHKSFAALKAVEELEKEAERLEEQENIFLQFKSFLANTKIAALAIATNVFLENIGSDLRLRFSGYTQLKSGKVREKISVSVLRGGTDCGSIGKLSAGEATRVDVALVLAMRELVNLSCEEGKGLDLLVIDELVDACDESGLSHIFLALNKLNITAWVVSHGHTSESYPHKLTVNKEGGISYLTTY